ncbi:MAG: aldo/keto reductase [Phycisphaerae bacterium SM23_33]|nr:MAG: aldo/keto reductase [Phycisphaerae bacterium SM23_33]
MKYGRVAGIDKPVSRLVQGCTGISSRELQYSFDLLDGVFALGCNAFDTAQIYGGGDSERTLGRWIRERGLGDKVVVITKGAHPNADRRRVTPFDIASDLHDSLARLKTGAIDLYLLHRDDPDVEVGPIIEALNEHLAAGRIRAFGGSNWTAERLAAANEYAAAHGLTGFAASSPNLSLAVPKEAPWGGCISISGPDGQADRNWYAQTQLPVFSWSSLAGGFWSGRFRRDNLATFSGYADELVVRCYCTQENFRRLDWAEKVAQEKGVSVAQVALAWLFRQPLNVFALTACRTPQEMADNVQALDLELPADVPE